MLRIIPLNDMHRPQVNAYIDAEWGVPIVTRGQAIDPYNLPGFAAVDQAFCGAVLYQIKANECEIVVLFSLRDNTGAGTALISAVKEEAQKAGCRRVFLITMNDNTRAIRFYQKRGFDLKDVYINAFEQTRRIKGIQGEVQGIDGIPVRHEFEFEMILNDR